MFINFQELTLHCQNVLLIRYINSRNVRNTWLGSGDSRADGSNIEVFNTSIRSIEHFWNPFLGIFSLFILPSLFFLLWRFFSGYIGKCCQLMILFVYWNFELNKIKLQCCKLSATSCRIMTETSVLVQETLTQIIRILLHVAWDIQKQSNQYCSVLSFISGSRGAV